MLWLDELTGPEVWPPYLSKPPLLMDNLEILEEARQAYERERIPRICTNSQYC